MSFVSAGFVCLIMAVDAWCSCVQCWVYVRVVINSVQWPADRCKTVLGQWWWGSHAEQDAPVREEDRDAAAASCWVGERSTYHFWMIIKKLFRCGKLCAVSFLSLSSLHTKTAYLTKEHCELHCIELVVNCDVSHNCIKNYSACEVAKLHHV